MLVLRWKYKGERGWKVPPNLRIGKREIPIGLASVFLALLIDCTGEPIYQERGHGERHRRSPPLSSSSSPSLRSETRPNRRLTERQMKEHFQLEHEDTIRPGSSADQSWQRDGYHARRRRTPCSEMGTEPDQYRRTGYCCAYRANDGRRRPGVPRASDQSFSEHEQMLFTKAVSVAESFGKHISLLVVPAGDIFAALVQTANSLEAAAVVSGLSTKHDGAGTGLPRRPGMGSSCPSRNGSSRFTS